MTEFSAYWNGTSIGDATSAPYDANTEFANWSRAIIGFAANRNDSGVLYGSGSESAQLEGLQVTQNSPAAANVLVNVGNALVHGTWYSNDSTVQLTVAANASGNPRIDTIILRKTWASQQVRAAILQGTPAASPVPPTLTQNDGVTWEIPLADIAVANGFATITNANITSRAIPTNGADGVYLDRINNVTGATNQTGDVLRLTPGGARTSAVGSLGQSLGIIWLGRTANAANGRAITRGIGYIRTSAAVTAGQFGRLSTTARAVDPITSARVANTICMFLETTSVAGLALAYIDATPFGDNFAPLAASNILAAPAASIAITGMPIVENNMTLIIEFYLRSAVVATSDTVNLRFGGAVLDTTAANYFSYQANISNSTPVIAAVQNLGATAGIQMTIAGSTAPANQFTHGILQVAAASVAAGAFQKSVTGHLFLVAGTTNGTIAVEMVGGRWLDTANDLNQLSLISNGGSNLATGSYINVYQKPVR